MFEDDSADGDNGHRPMHQSNSRSWVHVSGHIGTVKLAAGIAATLLAIVLFLIGVAAVKWYAWDIAISQAGQPDRSMLFWGLPILFVGLIATIVSVGLALLARRAFTNR